MSIFLIISFTSLILAIGGYVFRQEHLKYRRKLVRIIPDYYTSEHPGVKVLRKKQQVLANNVNLAKELHKNVKALSFPIPASPPLGRDWLYSYRRLSQTYTNKVFVTSLLKQGLFLVISPSKLFEVISSSSLIIGSAGSDLLKESYELIKDNYVEGMEALSEEALSTTTHQFLRELLQIYTKDRIKEMQVFAVAFDFKPIEQLFPIVRENDIILQSLDAVVNSDQLRIQFKAILEDKVQFTNEALQDNLAKIFEADPVPHVPVLSVIFDSIKETKRLAEGRTNIHKSLKRIAGKTVTKMSASSLGALIGGLIGGPPGAMAGAIGLSTIGKIIYKYQEHKPIRVALGKYKKVLAQEEKNCTKNVSMAIERIQTKAKTKRDKFFQKIGQPPSLPVNLLDQVIQQLLEANIQDLEYGEHRLLAVQRELFHRWPINHSIISLQKNLLEAHRESVLSIKTDFKTALNSYLNMEIVRNSFYDQALIVAAQEVSEIQAKYTDLLVIWAAQAVYQYRKTLNSIAKGANEEMKDLKQRIKKSQKRIESARKELVAAKEALS